MAAKGDGTGFLAPRSTNKLSVQILQPLCRRPAYRKALWTAARAAALPEGSRTASLGPCASVCTLGHLILPVSWER